VPNIRTDDLHEEDGYRRARLAEQAGADHLGLTVYELPPGTGMHLDYHLQREELLVVLEGTVAVRTGDGWGTSLRARCAPSRAASAAWTATKTAPARPCAC
jgi:uncharacterized cupin superfamily protein